MSKKRGRGRGLTGGANTSGRGRGSSNSSRGRGYLTNRGGTSTRGRGYQTNRGGASMRGRGRGNTRRGGRTNQNSFSSPLKQTRGQRGGMRPNRGGGRGRLQRQSSGVSPLNRSANKTPNTNNETNRKQRPRQKFATIQQKRKLAIQTLRKAKQMLSQIEKQTSSQTKRQNQFNQRRGLQALLRKGRGRLRGQNTGRGRGGALNIRRSTQKLDRNMSGSVVSLQTSPVKTKRPWRPNSANKQSSQSSMLTVSISNDSPPKTSPRGRGSGRRGFRRPGARRGNLSNMIKNLKPSVSRTYNINKNFFSNANIKHLTFLDMGETFEFETETGVSLSERFAEGMEDDSQSDISFTGRKVFM